MVQTKNCLSGTGSNLPQKSEYSLYLPTLQWILLPAPPWYARERKWGYKKGWRKKRSGGEHIFYSWFWHAVTESVVNAHHSPFEISVWVTNCPRDENAPSSLVLVIKIPTTCSNVKGKQKEHTSLAVNLPTAATMIHYFGKHIRDTDVLFRSFVQFSNVQRSHFTGLHQGYIT